MWCGTPGMAGLPLLSSLPDHIRYALALQLKLRPGWRADTPLPWAAQQWSVGAPRAGAEMRLGAMAAARGNHTPPGDGAARAAAELAELCDRVAVFYQGAMVGELSGTRLDEHVLLEAVNTGVVQEAA